MMKGADLSECGRYRYRLWRWWDESKPMACWIMLNPSIADAETDDPTIRKCIGFTKRWDEAGLHEAGGIMVVNLFGYRATDPHELRKGVSRVRVSAPEEPKANDTFLFDEAEACPLVVAAWGSHGWIADRGPHVRERLRKEGIAVHHLGLTATKQPRHPGRIAYATPLQRWWKS